MYQKIQPEQIQLHTFSAPSGDFFVTQGSNYVNLVLNRNLTGDFSLTGNILINGGRPVLNSEVSPFDSTGNTIIEGLGNSVSGTGNLLLKTIDSVISGQNNVILRGDSVYMDANATNNAVLAGNGVSFVSGVNGSVVIKDDDASLVEANRSNALFVSFANGADWDGDVNFENSFINLQNTSSLTLESGASIVASGDSYISGRFYTPTSYLASYAQVTGISGDLGNYLVATGASLDSKINQVSGHFTGVRAQAVYHTGAQNISGQKSFFDPVLFLSSGNAPTSSAAAGTAGTFVASGDFLFYCRSTNAWTRFSGDSTWP
jgi:hypothetical protein